MALLEKGLKCNLHYKPKFWTERLALGAETTINYVDPRKQKHIRHTVAEHLTKLK
jgi:hypothetical protein